MSPFIDGARLQQANANAKSRAERVDKLPIFPIGVHNVLLTGVRVLKNEKIGQTEAHIEITDPNSVYRTHTEVLRIAPKEGEEVQQYHDINLNILAGFFLSAFGHEQLQNADSLAGFVKQFSPYLNKPLQVAIQHQQRVMEPRNAGEKMTFFEEAHIWYTGDADKDQLTFNTADAIRPLSPKEQALWNDFKGPKHVAKGVHAEVGTTAVSAATKAAVAKPSPDFADKGTPEAAEADAAASEEEEVQGDVEFE